MITVHKVQPEKPTRSRKRNADVTETCAEGVPSAEDSVEDNVAVETFTTDDEDPGDDNVKEAIKHKEQTKIEEKEETPPESEVRQRKLHLQYTETFSVEKIKKIHVMLKV